MLSVAEATVSNSWSELDSLTAVKDEALRPVGAASFFLDPLPVCGMLRSLCCQWYGDGVDNTVEENSSVFPLIRMCRQQGRAGSKTVKNHPSLN